MSLCSYCSLCSTTIQFPEISGFLSVVQGTHISRVCHHIVHTRLQSGVILPPQQEYRQLKKSPLSSLTDPIMLSRSKRSKLLFKIKASYLYCCCCPLFWASPQKVHSVLRKKKKLYQNVFSHVIVWSQSDL